MRAVRYVVRGHVQGVGFRYFVSRQAEALGLAGWVRNLSGGAVEAVVAGEEGALSAFEGRLWTGPPHAAVENVQAVPADVPEWSGFRVLPTC